MSKDFEEIPDFIDIIFKNRNKKYGAYRIRKKYKVALLIGVLAGSTIMSAAVVIPFLEEKPNGIQMTPPKRVVEIKMQHLDIPPAKMVVPPPPPMPHVKKILQTAKYVAPKVVDTVMDIDTSRIMTSAQAKLAVSSPDTMGPIAEVTPAIPEPRTREKPFISVEEMPTFPGGQQTLMKYIAEHIRYPKVALQNNTEGDVIVKFCITSTGNVDQVSIIKGVSPELDAEAERVVKSLPKFIPGKQAGIPVPVWSVLPITFKLK